MTKLEQIEAIKNYIIQEIKPEKVILFGSYARGDYKENSDVDILIVMPNNTVSKADVYTKLYSNAPLFKGGRDFVVTTKKDFNYWKRALNHLFYNSTKDGKIIYDKKIHNS